MTADQVSEETPRSVSQRVVSVLTLFTSTGTLLCCALPAALATFAGGTAVIALTSAVPWLIPLSRHKDWIFLIATLMVFINRKLYSAFEHDVSVGQKSGRAEPESVSTRAGQSRVSELIPELQLQIGFE